MMQDTLKVSDDLTDSARQYRANILDVVSAMECALAGKPHPRIVNLTPEQRYWRMLAIKAADRPPTRERWEQERENREAYARGRVEHNKNSGFGQYRGYGQGRRMGD